MSTDLNPTRAKERILAIDFLRGFAILGILLMNIQSFSMPGAAYLNPTAYGDLTGLNKWVWIVSHIFADQKFMTIFSILFGAGVVIVTERAEAKTGKSASLHYKRNFWLLAIGLIHAHLIWYGDILVPYAICAFLVYFFRRNKPRTLLITGIIVIAVHTVIYGFMGTSLPQWPAESAAEIEAFWQPSAESIKKEIAATTGNLSEQIAKNSKEAIGLETGVFLMLFLWRAGGLMLVGMAFYKMGLLSASMTSRFYRVGFVTSWMIGLPLIILGIQRNFQEGWRFDYSMFLGSQYNYWGSLFISFGYICIIMLIAQSKRWMGFKKRFAAIGQMALTNYITQSIICVTIFYGVGFGYFGQVERLGQFGIVLLVWMVQITWSLPWLTKYRFGPLEWIWRSLTYGKMQKLKRD